jgi:hypothetical protein
MATDIAVAAANVCFPRGRADIELNASIKNATLVRQREECP